MCRRPLCCWTANSVRNGPHGPMSASAGAAGHRALSSLRLARRLDRGKENSYRRPPRNKVGLGGFQNSFAERLRNGNG